MLSCARWRGSHATVEQVVAYSFSSVEFRGFAVSGRDRTNWVRTWGGVKGDEASAPDDTLHYPTQRYVRLSQCVPRARHDNMYFTTLFVSATKVNLSECELFEEYANF